MTIKNFFGLLGALLVAAGGISPMLHLPIVGNWNYWDMDTTLATIVYFFVIAGLIASIVGKHALLRFSGVMILLVLALTLVGSYFKIVDYFSFIPMRKLASRLSGVVHYRWTGWGMIFAGSLIMILAGKKPKVHEVHPPNAYPVEDGVSDIK
jgi:hypothetical protein